jgi:signal transduction histidine kinase
MLRQPKYRAVYQIVIGVWLTLSVASVLLAAYSWVRLSQTLASARRFSPIGPQVDEILKTMLDSETGVRGFIITGDTNFLEPYLVAGTNSQAEFDQLAGLTAANTNLLRSVLDLRAQSEMLADYNHQVIDARKRDFRSAEVLIASGKGKQIMDQIRAQVSALEVVYSHERTNDRAALDAQFVRATTISLIAGIIGIIAGIFAFWLARVTIKNQIRERELIEARLLAERNSREKSAFLANMSHEIRTPMNAIFGFSELLQGELQDPKHSRYLKSIRSSAASLLQLINDILDMSKIESGLLELRPEPTDAREICDFIRTLFAEPALNKGLKLECLVAENLPRALMIDRVRLRQILVNLVGNAIKFTDRGRVDVRVSSQKQPDSSHVTLAIEVSDTGVGIPQDRQTDIFKPFVQAGAHRDKEVQGTGLGLSIVKRLVEMMGGAVTISSELGKGSVFSLRFLNIPVSARLPASAKISADDPVNFNKLRPTTFLVVDDNEANRQYMAGIFETTHHRLFFCASGEEAVLKAREIVPDLLLLDVRMPGMDGREALAEIRKIPGMELVPAIAVTASTQQDDYFSGFVRKPFSTRELFNELTEFLPRHLPSDPPAEAEGVAMAETAAGPVPEELLAQLAQLLKDPWPALCNTMAVNEIKAFSRQLDILAELWHCKPLKVYAGTLLRDAEAYDVANLEKHLVEFAALVEKLNKENSLMDKSGTIAAPSEGTP